MIDFIFQVDLSTIYVILRRDFASATDKIGTLTTPLGGSFYYTAASANDAARQYCQREATKRSTMPNAEASGGSGSAVHGEKDGLYRGGCVTRELGRERFEIRVKRLRAKGTGTGVGGRIGGGGVERGREAGGRLGVLREESERADGDDDDDNDGARTRQRVSSATTSRSSSVLSKENKHGSKIGRFWETVRRK